MLNKYLFSFLSIIFKLVRQSEISKIVRRRWSAVGKLQIDKNNVFRLSESSKSIFSSFPSVGNFRHLFLELSACRKPSQRVFEGFRLSDALNVSN